MISKRAPMAAFYKAMLASAKRAGRAKPDSSDILTGVQARERVLKLIPKRSKMS